MSHNKTIISILISLIIICLVCGGCSEKVQTLEKNRIYILDGENMSDDMLGELSEYGCEEYKALKYKDDFPEGIILKLPCGDIAVKKMSDKSNSETISKLGQCNYAAENGDIYRVDRNGRLTHFECVKRANSVDKDLFYDGEKITAEQAVEKAKEYISAYIGDFVLKYTEPKVSSADESSQYDHYIVSFSPPISEGYVWFADANVFLSENGSLLIINNLASDIEQFTDVPEGFSEKVDSLVSELTDKMGMEYTYVKYALKLLDDGRLAATGVIKPYKDGEECQPISIIVPIE